MSSRQYILVRMLRSAQSFLPILDSLKSNIRWNYYSLIRAVAEPEFSVLRAILPKQPICIDIGANRGLTIQSILNVLPSAKILAFEPNKMLAQLISNRFALNANVEILNLGIGKTDDDLLLYIPKYRNYVYDCLGSTDKESAETWLSENTCWLFQKKWLSIVEMPIRIAPLDKFNLAPSFVKVDVQGTNEEVIIGGLRTIKLHQPVILMETPEDSVREILFEIGYGEYYVQSSVIFPGKGRINSLFIPSSRLSCA